MKLWIPPAVVFLIFGALMYLLARFLPVGDFDFFGRDLLAITLTALAFLTGFLALYQFHRAKTSVNPMVPARASQLVTDGIYRFSRNPMYLAMLFILLALGLKLGNAFNTITAALYVAYMNKYQIIPEEEVLNKIFGKAYQQYCLQVRRWF
jgi:protein-S-isoprenylcysteine O-methyltransferase Ste14